MHGTVLLNSLHHVHFKHYCYAIMSAHQPLANSPEITVTSVTSESSKEAI